MEKLAPQRDYVRGASADQEMLSGGNETTLASWGSENVGPVIDIVTLEKQVNDTRPNCVENSGSFVQMPTGKNGLSTTWSWIVWICSVLLVSSLMSKVQLNFNSFWTLFQSSPKPAPSNFTQVNVMETIPTYVASLHKRATCVTGGATSGQDYNTPLHVGALFIILFVSGSACAFPLLAVKYPRLRIPPIFLFAARHFGTGVLIATAFVHLLPTAFIMLGNPCLSNFWTNDYPAMPGAIVLAAIFFVTLIEMIFSPAQHMCGGSQALVVPTRPVKTQETKTAKVSASSNNESAIMDDEDEVTATTVGQEKSKQLRKFGPLIGRSSSVSRTVARMGVENERLDGMESGRNETQPKKNDDEDEKSPDAETASTTIELTPEQANKRAIMQCVLLEVGILFHSVFIGMSLSVSIGSEFVILLIAITFHQTFEGLALGSRIAGIKWPENSYQPWLMAFAYGSTTPIGQAIGLAVHNLYSPDSETGLLLVGIMNAISSGLLVFASLVELMSEDFLSDESWRILRGKRRVWACILVFSGAFLMSLVGAWA